MATKEKIIILNKFIECSKKGFRLVSVSFLVVSMAMVVTLVNKEYFFDTPWDHDNMYIVASIDYLNDMHNRLAYGGGHGGSSGGGGGGITTMASSAHTNNNNNNNNNGQGEEIVLAQLNGESAQKITKAMRDGTMIKFNVFDDGSLVELVQEIENNIPDDKRQETLKSI